MPPIENDTVCTDEDLDIDDEESQEEDYRIAPAKRLDGIDEDGIEEDSGCKSFLPHRSTSASQVNVAVSFAADPIPAVQTVNTSLPAADSSPEFNIHRIHDDVTNSEINQELKSQTAFDESRRFFQRLWTDEDEMELLQGFLNYTRLNSSSGKSSSYHHDKSAFYNQIKNKLQLDFNKNQLIDKLRRVKKKYKTIISKIGSGQQYTFKNSHDEATFDICKQIWSTDDANNNSRVRGRSLLENDDTNPNSNMNPNYSLDPYSSGKKSSIKRFRNGSPKIQQDIKPQIHQQTTATTVDPNPIPLLKDPLLSSSGRDGLGDMTMEEKWRKQQIMEYEVYSKRLDLIQEEIKTALNELRSME